MVMENYIGTMVTHMKESLKIMLYMEMVRLFGWIVMKNI